MPSKENFKNYTAIQFATDVDFISWVKWPDEEGDLFWEEYIHQNPAQRAVVKKARAIVSNMHIVQPSPNEVSADNTWQTIVQKIETEVTVSRPRTISMYRKWMAAAAVAVFLLGGTAYFLLQNQSSEIIAVNRTEKIPADIAPGGNVATLTLADGSTISLDNAVAGSLAQQGPTNIVKLKEGQLAYQQDGRTPASTALQYNTVSTPRGGQYQLVLADGTKVWLNAESSIRFPTGFAGKERNVEITGEAYFEVAHNASAPFRVKAASVEVKVLGTSFNVNAYEDENSIRTTLLEGSVEILSGKANGFLKPGAQANVVKMSDDIRVIENINKEEATAWKDGLFYFNEDNIEAVMKKIARWYDVEVEMKGPVSQRKFNGKLYRDANLSEVIKILEEGGIKINIVGKKVIVTK